MSKVDINGGIRHAWKGHHYSKSILGQRLLIVGESHYTKTPGADISRTQAGITLDVVQQVIEGRRIPFFSKVASSFSQEPAEFFQRVAFYNYMQEVLDGPRQPLREAQRVRDNDQALFFKTLQKLRPDRVLVLGKTNWRYLPNKFPGDKDSLCSESNLRLKLPGKLHRDEQFAYWYRTGRSHWALVGAITHPARPGFRAKDWQSWIKKFMAFEGEPPK